MVWSVLPSIVSIEYLNGGFLNRFGIVSISSSFFLNDDGMNSCTTSQECSSNTLRIIVVVMQISNGIHNPPTERRQFV